jgi:hypothetical protein
MGKKILKKIIFVVVVLSITFFSTVFLFIKKEQLLDPIDYNLPATAREIIEKRIQNTATFEISPGKFAQVSGIVKEEKASFWQILFSNFAKAVSSGPNSPSTVVDNNDGNTIWVNSSNATTSDDNRATATLGVNGTSNYLKATNFGFSIPEGVTINGVIAQVEFSSNDGEINGSSAMFVKNGSLDDSYDYGSIMTWGITDGYHDYGSNDENLNAFTISDINNSGFGFAINVGCSSELFCVNGDIARIDHIRIIVYYTSANTAPDVPPLISPLNAYITTDNTPTLHANYIDPDAGDVGTTNFRIATSAVNCTNGVVVASGISSITPDNIETVTWTPSSSIGVSGIYYWCAQNNDGVAQSAWASPIYFILDTATPDIVAVDAGASLTDRTSFTSNMWFKYTSTGSDDQVSFSWTDPSSASDDTFYYEINSDSGNTITGDELMVANPYIDSIIVSEGINYFHVRPKNGAVTWGTERTFIIKYDKTNPLVDAGSDQIKEASFIQDAITSDTTSGIVSYLWEKQSGTGIITFGTATSEDTTISSDTDGTFVIKLTVADTAGNTNTDTMTLVWDTIILTRSNISPANNSTITDSTQTITFTTNENATCYLSLDGDESYANMSDDTLCIGANTTSQSCATPVLDEGVNYVYIACTDGTNPDTVDTNERLIYNLDTTTTQVSSAGGNPMQNFNNSDIQQDLKIILMQKIIELLTEIIRILMMKKGLI